MGRPEKDPIRVHAMTQLGNGIFAAERLEDALHVEEANLSMLRRIGAHEEDLLAVQGNLACTYKLLGRLEIALRVRQDVYSRRLKLNGEEASETLRAANNCATSLLELQRFEETKSLLRKTVPAARRVLGESHMDTLRMTMNYTKALILDDSATVDDLREAVSTLEDVERIARRVFGGAHPLVKMIEHHLRASRAVLRARET